MRYGLAVFTKIPLEYPYGIAADKLSETCRIVTAADIWVSLTENRSALKTIEMLFVLKTMGEMLISARDRKLLRALEATILTQQGPLTMSCREEPRGGLLLID